MAAQPRDRQHAGLSLGGFAGDERQGVLSVAEPVAGDRLVDGGGRSITVDDATIGGAQSRHGALERDPPARRILGKSAQGAGDREGNAPYVAEPPHGRPMVWDTNRGGEEVTAREPTWLAAPPTGRPR